MRQRLWVRVVVVAILVGLGAAVRAGAATTVPDQILSLVAEGQDQGAISLYEQEVDPEEASLELLRAVAGSYWRLRRFETARELYRRIMRQQPTLAAMVPESEPPAQDQPRDKGDDTPAEAPATAEPPPPVEESTDGASRSGQPEKGQDNQETETTALPLELDAPAEQPAAPAQADQAPTAESSPPAGVQAEMEALHQTYVELEAERERQRQQLEERILGIMRHTEQTLGQMDDLRAQRNQMQADKAQAVARSESLEASMTRKEAQWGGKIQDLEREIERVDAAYQALEQESTARIVTLEETLGTVRTAAAEAAKRAAMLEQEIAQQTAQAVQRKDALQAARTEVATMRDQSLAKQAQWQARLTELEEQLDTERVAARARRDQYLQQEAELQERLAARAQNQTQLAGQLEQLKDQLAASKVRISDLAAERDLLSTRMANVAQAKQQQAEANASRENALTQEIEKRQSLYEKTQQTVTQLLAQAEAEARQRDSLANELAAERRRKAALEKTLENMQALFVRAIGAEQARNAELTDALQALQQEQAQEHEAAEERRREVDAEQTRLEQSLRQVQDRMAGLVEMAEAQDHEIARMEEQARARQRALEDELDAARSAQAEAQALARRLETEHRAALAEQQQQQDVLEAGQRELQAQLAQRDQEVARLEERLAGDVQHQVLGVALQEIELLEQDYRRMEQRWQQEQAELLGQIAAMRIAQQRGQTEKAELEAALASAQDRQAELETNLQAQEEALARANATIDEATAALARQYDALREQIETGVSMSIDGNTPAAGDLSPLILRLEEATESATMESEDLRKQFEQERLRMQQRMEAVVGQRDALTETIQQLKQQHVDTVARLEHQLTGVQDDLAQTETRVKGLQEELRTERAEQQQALRVAEQQAARLLARIAELEHEPPAKSVAEDKPLAETPGVADTASGLSDDALLQAMRSAAQESATAAIAVFEARNRETPTSLAALREAGRHYRALERHQEAYAAFRDLLARDPGNIQAEQGIVMSLFDLGDYDQALKYLSEYGETQDEVRVK